MHEIGHSLGFIHEHSRPDRDDHVSIDVSNIVKNTEFNFEKFSTDLIDTSSMPYDYTSIMHYGINVSACICDTDS
jgi:tolkin protein